MGRKPGRAYVRSWQMQPLGLAQLSALTPPAWDRVLLDDRIREVRGDEPADLCAISIETYTARRGYQIAAAFRRRGIPVAVGWIPCHRLSGRGAGPCRCRVRG